MQAIPLILTGRDIVIHSETGSGKTLAFLLPILKMFQQTPPSADPAVVIIEPTRELASQVLKECAYFMTAPLVHDFSPIQFYDESLDPHFFTPDGRFQHRVLGAWGGESVQDQRTELQKGIDVIVSTPGRLIDLMGKKLVRLDHTKVFILDEADKAVDIEMENQIRTIANMLPEQGTQTILCSATFPISVKRLINSCITDPITVRINAIDETRGGLSSSVVVNTIVTTSSNRFDALLDTLRSIPSPPVLIFVNSIAAIESLVTMLQQEQFHCCGIHSDYPQDVRNAIMRAFREGVQIG